MQRELLSDQFINLEQAGHTTEQKIPMSHVFVDLPFQDPAKSHELPPSTQLGTDGSDSLFAATVLELAGNHFDPTSAASRGHATPESLGRMVLLGGPGQGKTTLSQYICQLFRTALLKDRSTLSPESAEVVRTIETQRCE